MRKALKLKGLKVKSFVTELSEIKGGNGTHPLVCVPTDLTKPPESEGVAC